MPRIADQALPLQDWCVLSLRPRGQHASVRAAAARRGARVLALSPFAIEACSGTATRDALRHALAADVVLFTSPNAVETANALQPLRRKRAQAMLAVGSATARALEQLGLQAPSPSRMDSEGLLARPELSDIRGQRIGLVTGTGGRNLLAPTLRARGARVVRADVYRRKPLPLPPHVLDRLRVALSDPRRCLLPLSSDEAMQQVLGALPAPLRGRFTRVAVIAASARLAGIARDIGFRRVAIASDARAAALLRAGANAFG